MRSLFLTLGGNGESTDEPEWASSKSSLFLAVLGGKGGSTDDPDEWTSSTCGVMKSNDWNSELSHAGVAENATNGGDGLKRCADENADKSCDSTKGGDGGDGV